jgi:multicomponent Na+:H+ antiporter subunit C
VIGAPFAVVAYAAASAVLVGLGTWALVARPNLLTKVMAVNVIGGGVFLLLVAIARREPEGPPDPVPHALVLTGIVVAVAMTAFAVALVRRLHRDTGATRLPDDEVEQP